MLLAPALVTVEGAAVVVDDGTGVWVACGVWVAFVEVAGVEVEVVGAGAVGLSASTPAVTSSRPAPSSATILWILFMIDFSQMICFNHNDGGVVLVSAGAAGVGAFCITGCLWAASDPDTGARV